MNKLFSFIGVFALMAALVGVNAEPASAQSLTPISEIESGDLIRGESFSAVYYYGKDGFRYVFPNDKTYFTWYNDFSSVKWVSDEDLADIQIGGNVTYKPGVKMVKIDTDPKTYAVDENGTLRWVANEDVAVALYGSDWNQQIDDVPDAFFGNYQSGSAIETSEDYDRSSVRNQAASINENRGLQSPIVISIADMEYNPSDITIEPGRAVKFVNNGTEQHTATATDLDWGTGTLQPGEHFSRYFRDAGTYDYFCSYHPTTMSGQLIVE